MNGPGRLGLAGLGQPPRTVHSARTEGPETRIRLPAAPAALRRAAPVYPSPMARPRLYSVATGLLLVAIVTACAGTAPSPAQPSPRPASRYPHTEADVRFMANMIGHHSQALTMAGLAPTHGASPSVRRLAERIMSGQQDEIATMHQWLRDRGDPIPEGHH